MSEARKVFVGIDWSTSDNYLCVVDATGGVLHEAKFKHTPEGLERLAGFLNALVDGESDTVRVAIEVPHGPIVELLVGRGFLVHSINPKQLDRFRDRFTVAGAKDDRLDARVLADSLRTDAARFRRLEAEEPCLIELRELSRVHTELIRVQTRLVNQIHAQLARYYPQFSEVTTKLQREWVRALLRVVPTPEHARRVRPSRIRSLLKRPGLAVDADAIITGLRQNGFEVSEATVRAASAHVLMALDRLDLVCSQIKACVRQLDALLAQFADTLAPDSDTGHEDEVCDVTLLMSLTGIGTINLAILLAEAWEPLRDRDYHRLRALSGVAPVTRQSGQKRVVSQRRACNPRLRDALYNWARVAAMKDPKWKLRYKQLRTKGHTPSRAHRAIGDRLLKVACAILNNRTLYDTGSGSRLTA